MLVLTMYTLCGSYSDVLLSSGVLSFSRPRKFSMFHWVFTKVSSNSIPPVQNSFCTPSTSTTMPEHSLGASQAPTSCSGPVAEGAQQPAKQTNRRIRWAEPVAKFYPNMASPAATSALIQIPGREPSWEETMMRPHLHQRIYIPKHLVGVQLPPDLKEAEPRVHHRLDNITDYCLPGAHGWQSDQEKRVQRSDAQAGKILWGEWQPASLWKGKQCAIRRDRDFGFIYDRPTPLSNGKMGNKAADGVSPPEESSEDWEDDDWLIE
jgi:hypothetical protein